MVRTLRTRIQFNPLLGTYLLVSWSGMTAHLACWPHFGLLNLSKIMDGNNYDECGAIDGMIGR
jgi:hypothetical protein